MMYQLAQITNGVITNIFDCLDVDQSHFPDAIRVDDITPQPAIGWTYENGVFAPPAAPPVLVKTVYSPYGFRSLFTLAELVSIDGYQTSTILTTEQKAVLFTITKNFDSATEIDIQNPNTIQSVDYLANIGLITRERAGQILSGTAPTQLPAVGIIGATGATGATGAAGNGVAASVTSYTPTLSGTSMTFTSGNGSTGQTGNYFTVGNICNFSATITMANVNVASLVNATSGASNFAITLPVNAAKNGLMTCGYTVKSDGKIYGILGKTAANSNVLTLWTVEKEIKALDKDSPFGAGAWLTSYTIYLTGTYQTI